MNLITRKDELDKRLKELYASTTSHPVVCDCDECVEFEELTHEKVILDNQLRKRAEQVAADDQKKSSDLTVAKYKQLKAKKVTDREIMKEYAFAANAFNKWKRDNNLIEGKVKPMTKKKAVPVNVLAKKMEQLNETEQGVYIAEQLEKLRDEVEPVYIENSKLLSENERLTKRVAELESSSPDDGAAKFLLNIIDQEHHVIDIIRETVNVLVGDGKWDEVEQVAKAVQEVFN